MTSFPNSPEDALDRWLDDLADDPDARPDGELADAAAYLQRHFGLPGAEAFLGSNERNAIRARMHDAPASMPVTKRSAGASGIVADPAGGTPVGRLAGPWRVASLVAAAVLVLIAAATLGAVLRSDNVERMPGAVATASVMPFAPQPALASATPAACVTDDTLLISPDDPVESGAFRDLPFSVAWYRDGVLTVENSGKVVREIDVGEVELVQPTEVPNVVIAQTWRSTAEGGEATFVNIATGEMANIGRYNEFVPTHGPYLFWTPDRSFARWHVIDLRTFETADLAERFRLEPSTSWRPRYDSMLASDDGSTLLVGTAPYTNAIGSGTPIASASDRPTLDIGQNVILIDGSLDDMRLVGPLAWTKGAMALSPDGKTVAWLARVDSGGERILVIVDASTGDMISERPVEATYANSLLFSADGTVLYSKEGERLKRIAVRPQVGTPGVAGEPFTLLDEQYQILATSPDRTKLLLAWDMYAVEGVSVWLDLDTGETREIDGSPARLFVGRIPAVTGPFVRYVFIDDRALGSKILDMETGEIAVTTDRDDSELPMISEEGSTMFNITQEYVEFIDLPGGTTTAFPAPRAAIEFSRSFATTQDGSCAAITWPVGDDVYVTHLYSESGGEIAPLPASAVGGWVSSGT